MTNSVRKMAAGLVTESAVKGPSPAVAREMRRLSSHHPGKVCINTKTLGPNPIASPKLSSNFKVAHPQTLPPSSPQPLSADSRGGAHVFQTLPLLRLRPLFALQPCVHHCTDLDCHYRESYPDPSPDPSPNSQNIPTPRRHTQNTPYSRINLTLGGHARG